MTIVVSSTSVTTALDIIKRAMRLLGVYSAGEDMSPEESSDALDVLNALLAEFSNGSMVYAKTLDTIALAANQASVTVGPTGSTVTSRPVRVLPESYVVLSGVSYPLSVLTLQDYDSIGLKTMTGIPRNLWVQADMPNVTVTMWPVPSEAMSLNLWSAKQFASFPSLTTSVSLPPGYENALPNLLAVEMAPEYEVQPPGAVLQAAARGRRILKRTNLQVPTLSLPRDVTAAPVFLDIRQF